MADTTVLSVRISPETKAKLEALAASTRRSKSFLAGEAVATYVDRQLDYVRKVEEGLRDMREGRTVPHDVVMRHMEEIIRQAEERKAASER